MHVVQTTYEPHQRIPMSWQEYDAVLDLPVAKVQEKLACCPLRADVEGVQAVRVGVVIRPGAGVQVQNLARKLVDDWEQGALALHCYLMIVNSDSRGVCDVFEKQAAGFGLRARGISLPMAELSRDALRDKLIDAAHDLCLERAGAH